ncbi:MAG: ketosteroid isomerase [Pseudonocardiales bacterium]|nr:ketosteroid isomerase [Pseudonocardiales bacterium]
MTASLPVDDVLALLALQAEYADGADSFSGVTYAQVFTDDAILDPSGTGVPAVVGRTAIAKLMDDSFAQQTHNCHMTTNQRVLSVDGDRATGRCYFFQRSILRNGGRTEFSGRYEDEYLRTADGWKISKRVLIELLPTVLEGYDVPDGS